MAKQPSPTRARHRSFSAKGKAPTEPVTFDLDGTEFTCHPQVPGTVILEHADRLMNRRTATKELLAIWPDVMTEEEHRRFREYVDDPSHEIDVQVLGEILAFVLGELSGRPTPPPSPSERGRSKTGDTSTSEPDEPEPDETEED